MPRSVWIMLIKLANGLEKPALYIGSLVSWLMLPLIFIIVFDAITRKFLRKLDFVIDHELYVIMNSPVLQDAEWHLHTLMFVAGLSFAYVYNAHVRLDLFRPKLGSRGRLWVELVLGFLLLIPFLLIFGYFAWDFFVTAWVNDETSGMVNGIDNRWAIKFSLFLGIVLMMSVTLSMILRITVHLFGPADLHAQTRLQGFTDDSHSAFT